VTIEQERVVFVVLDEENLEMPASVLGSS